MTNNFELYKEYITNEFKNSVLDEGDTYFVVELIRRGKDNPDNPAANYHFKIYYLRKPEDLDKYREEIVKICELLKLRAYASVNYKSFKQVTLNTLAELARRVSNDDFHKSYNVYEFCSGSYCNSKNKRWVIDIDNCDLDDEKVQSIKNIIYNCEPNGNKIITSFPTKSGIHLITKPFDRMEFQDNLRYFPWEHPEIKKNHLTLLYENI